MKKIDLLMAASYKLTIIRLTLHLSEASFVLFTLTRTKVKNIKAKQYNATSIAFVMTNAGLVR